ncbi:MAG: type II secretion system protein GspL [Pseudomonadota bacterium]
MAEVLVIRLGENAPTTVEWIVVDSQGSRLGHPVTGPLSAAQVDARDRKIIALLPAAAVLTTAVDIPVKSTAKILQALPFALEEIVADDVEDLHFAAGQRKESGDIPVSIIAHERLNAYIDLLNEAGIDPDAFVSENHGLANLPGTISMLIAEDQILINDGDKTDLALQGIGPAEAMAAIGAYEAEERPDGDDDEVDDAAPSAPRHVLIYCEAGLEQTYGHDFIALRHDFESLDVKLLPDGMLPRLAVTVASGAGVNLLQGQYGAKTEYSSYFRPWRYAAMLLLGLGLVATLNKGVSYFQLSQREAELREAFMSEYRQIVPGAPDVADPAAAVNSLRARTGGANATAPVFLQSLEHLSTALGENDEADVQAISYRAGVVDIRLSAPSVSVLDNVQRLVDEGGAFDAAIQSTDQDGDKVNSRIQIKAAGQ